MAEQPDKFGMTADNYRELLELIAGRGRWRLFGGAGFHTWPGAGDDQQKTHDVLVEMEFRGWVRRVIDDPDHCCFQVTGKEVNG